jgi:hypothetical protein
MSELCVADERTFVRGVLADGFCAGGKMGRRNPLSTGGRFRLLDLAAEPIAQGFLRTQGVPAFAHRSNRVAAGVQRDVLRFLGPR